MDEISTIDWRGLESFVFGDSPELADQLAGLVLAGCKTATCWAATNGLLTEVGKMMVMRGGAGQPLAIVQTVELTQRHFDEVNAAFAWDEGEDDRSLDSWRQAHREYFIRQGNFAPDMLLYCERFRLLARLDTDASPDEPGA
jgi:uncharacterized protein YhfF